MNKHTTCLICNSNQLVQLKGYYERKGLVKCADCGFAFMENIPSDEELKSYYSLYAYQGEGSLSPITVKSYNTLLDEFEKYRKHNKILDLGCGRGWFLIEAKKRGWEIYGTEYSETAIQICENNGIKISKGKLRPESFSQESFDVITSFEVIEHINNPIEELGLMKTFLRKDGLFYCTTPNFNSILRYYLKENLNLITYPEHLSYYTVGTLNHALSQNGFKPIKTLTTGISLAQLKPPTTKQNTNVSTDEALRLQIDNKWYLAIAKNLVNRMLTLFRLGVTLKVYYLKK